MLSDEGVSGVASVFVDDGTDAVYITLVSKTFKGEGRKRINKACACVCVCVCGYVCARSYVGTILFEAEER